MHPSIKSEGIDIGEKGVQEIMTYPIGLVLVERESIHEVQLGIVEDPDSHETRFRICSFAVSQSVKPTAPDSMSFVRSSRMRPCQSGGV